MARHSVLIIEDEWDIAQLLKMHLQELCDVTLACDGREGMRLALDRPWSLLILDLGLPGPDGLSICRAARRELGYVPILILSSRSAELDRVHGLELGADDYVTKPFSVLELTARVKSILRRVDALQKTGPARSELVTSGPLTIDTGSREVWLDDAAVALTAREFDLLLHFVRHPGLVFSRAQLLDSVWGYGHDGYEHTVNSHINRLRAKIEPNPSQPTLIRTVWGVGYRLAEHGTRAGAAPVHTAPALRSVRR